MTIETGYITEVNVTIAGSGLLGDHAVGAGVLALEDASDFNDEGGTVSINGVQYDYISVDFDLDTITLNGTLAVAASDTDAVQVYPIVVEKVASVVLEQSNESIQARLPHSLVDRIPEGVREDALQEAVEVELVNFEWVVIDVMGKEPVIDGSYLGDSTVTLAALGDDINMGGINIYAQSSDPVANGAVDGDFWLDTTVLGDGTTNVLKNRVAGAWVIVQDASVKAAISAATAASNLADSKMRIYYQTSAPTGLTSNDIGDLWFDTDDYNHPYKYNGNANPALAWDDMSDGRIAAAVTDAAVARVAALPDGLAPSSSPQPTVTGTVGALLIRWTPISNHDPVTYSVYVSATSGFTPSSSTLITSTMGSSIVVKTLTDGTTLAYGTTYYVKIIASDVDGSAPAGLQTSGSMVKITSPDVAADFVYAGRISVDRLDGGTLVSDLLISSTLKSADTGARVEMGAAGIKVFDPTSTPTTILGSDGNSTFKGDVEANGLTIKGGATFRSTNNEIAQGGILRLSQKTTASAQAPTVVVDWPTVTLRDAAGLPLAHPENLSGLLRTAAGKWAACDLTQPQYYLWNADGTLSSTVTTNNIFRGLTEIGGKLYGYYLGTSASDLNIVKVARLANETVITDSFTDISQWTSAGTTASVSGTGQVTAASGATSSLSRTISGLFNGAVSQKVTVSGTRPVTSQTFMRVLNGTTVLAEISVNGPQISFTYYAPAANTTSITYDSTAHAYWRILDTGNPSGVDNVVFATSPDGVTWTTQKTVSAVSVSTATTWRLGLYNPGVGSNSAPSPGFDTWEVKSGNNFNTPVNWYSISPGDFTQYYFIDDATVVDSGAKSGKMLFSSSAWSRPGGFERLELGTASGNGGVPVLAGTNYLYTVRFAVNGGGGFIHPLLNIDWYNSSGTLISSTNNVRTSSTNYTTTVGSVSALAFAPLSITATAPTGAAYARLRVAGESTGNSSSAMWFDSASFAQNTGTPPVATTSSTFDDALQVRVTNGVSIGTGALGNEIPVIGTDGTNVVLAYQIQSSALINVKTYSTTNFAQLSSANTTTAQTPAGHLTGVLRGSFDLGTDSWVVAGDLPGGNWYAFPAATNVINANQTFPSSDVGNKGIAWDGTNFWSLGANGKLYQYGTLTWTTETSSWTAAFTWFGSGSQESTISPSNAFTMKKRARLTVTSSVLPSAPSSYDPTNIKVYVSRDATMHYQATSAAGVNSVTLTTVNFAGATPPASNNFLSGVDASIRTQNDNLIIKADGSITAATVTTSGLLKGATVTSTGLLTAGSITTAGTLNAGTTTLGATTVASIDFTGDVGWSTSTTGWVVTNSAVWALTNLSWRRQGNVMNFYALCTYLGAGVTSTTGNIADQSLFTIPAGYRPQSRQTNSFEIAGSASGNVRIETTGVVLLTTATATIATNQQAWFSFCYLLP